MVPTTKPEEIEQHALGVVEQWKLGRKKVDDGALLLIAEDDRTLRIEVGYGIEGQLNDATAKRIVSDLIAPRLKEGDYFGGVSTGVDQMIRVVDGDALPEAMPEALPIPKPGALGSGLGSGCQNIEQLLPSLFVVAPVVGGVLQAVLGRIPGALATGGVLALAGRLLGGGGDCRHSPQRCRRSHHLVGSRHGPTRRRGRWLLWRQQRRPALTATADSNRRRRPGLPISPSLS